MTVLDDGKYIAKVVLAASFEIQDGRVVEGTKKTYALRLQDAEPVEVPNMKGVVEVRFSNHPSQEARFFEYMKVEDNESN